MTELQYPSMVGAYAKGFDTTRQWARQQEMDEAKKSGLEFGNIERKWKKLEWKQKQEDRRRVADERLITQDREKIEWEQEQDEVQREKEKAYKTKLYSKIGSFYGLDDFDKLQERSNIWNSENPDYQLPPITKEMRDKHKTPDDLVRAMETELKRSLGIKEGSKAKDQPIIQLQAAADLLPEDDERRIEIEKLIEKMIDYKKSAEKDDKDEITKAEERARLDDMVAIERNLVSGDLSEEDTAIAMNQYHILLPDDALEVYVYIPEVEIKGFTKGNIFGINKPPVTKKVKLPKRHGVQVTMEHVRDKAYTEGKTIQEVLDTTFEEATKKELRKGKK